MTADEKLALGIMKTLAEAEISTGVSLVKILRPHATDVMEIHGLRPADVLFALTDATGCARQASGRYCVASEIDGADWTLVVEVESEMVLVTLFEVKR